MKKILAAGMCVMMLITIMSAYIPASADAGFYATAELLEIKEHIEYDAGMDEYATAQGACTDGKYAYFAVQQGTTAILKYSLKNWELVDKKEFHGELGHANDMTYNPNRNLILVANNGPDYNVLTGIDPDTLEIRGYATLKLDVYSIAYNPDRDIYVVGISGGYKFALLNNRFKVIKKFKGEETGYTRQGCDCDSDYIYFVQSGGDNAVVVYDYAGKLVDILSLGHSHEVENIFHVFDSYYTTLHFYGNSVHRVGLSDSTQIRYRVMYRPGEGYGEMKATSVHYGESTLLRKNTFHKPGYLFGGWRASRTSDDKYLGYRKFSKESEWMEQDEVYEYDLYYDGEPVSQTVRYGDVVMTPFWINSQYNILYDPDGAQGYMADDTVGYYDDYIIPECGYERPGFIFTGFTAYRDYDNKYYGYRKGQSVAEWLEEADLEREYEFKSGEVLSSMTYDGSVTLTPVFRFAYTYSEDKTALIEYIGMDEIVNVPNPSLKLNTIASGAFKDNNIFTELHFPEMIDTLESKAIDNCSRLKGVYFKDHFPTNYASDCITRCDTPVIYVEYDKELYAVGYASDDVEAQLLRFNVTSLKQSLDDRKEAEVKKRIADRIRE